VILNKPVIQIIRNKDGKFNFSTIGKDKKEKQKDPAKAEKEPTEKDQRVPPQLLIAVVDISG